MLVELIVDIDEYCTRFHQGTYDHLLNLMCLTNNGDFMRKINDSLPCLEGKRGHFKKGKNMPSSTGIVWHKKI